MIDTATPSTILACPQCGETSFSWIVRLVQFGTVHQLENRSLDPGEIEVTYHSTHNRQIQAFRMMSPGVMPFTGSRPTDLCGPSIAWLMHSIHRDAALGHRDCNESLHSPV